MLVVLTGEGGTDDRDCSRSQEGRRGFGLGVVNREGTIVNAPDSPTRPPAVGRRALCATAGDPGSLRLPSR